MNKAARLLMVNILGLNTGYITASREENELYTPFYAVEPIIKYLPKDKVIWCPFDKRWSAFTVLLKEHGYNVIFSHIDTGEDFFSYEPDEWDIIVSNPPFSIKDKIIKRLYSFDKSFAVLLPLNSLQGKIRYEYFKEGIQILTFDTRINFHKENSMDVTVKGSPFATAYFCKDLLPKDLIVEKLEPYERVLR